VAALSGAVCQDKLWHGIRKRLVVLSAVVRGPVGGISQPPICSEVDDDGVGVNKFLAEWPGVAVWQGKHDNVVGCERIDIGRRKRVVWEVSQMRVNFPNRPAFVFIGCQQSQLEAWMP
jgi:hypothetical protein